MKQAIKVSSELAMDIVAVGVALGDRWSHCALSGDGEVAARGRVATTSDAVLAQSQLLRGARVAIENGTHSGWFSRALPRPAACSPSPTDAQYFCIAGCAGPGSGSRNAGTGAGHRQPHPAPAQAQPSPLRYFLQDRRNRMMLEPRRIQEGFRGRTNRNEVSAKQWADGYLAAFAEAAELRLVTFDKALAASANDSHLLLFTP